MGLRPPSRAFLERHIIGMFGDMPSALASARITAAESGWSDDLGPLASLGLDAAIPVLGGDAPRGGVGFGGATREGQDQQE